MARNGRTARARGRRPCQWDTGHADIIRMLKWMARHGFRSDVKLKPKTFPSTGRGLMISQSALAAGDVIVKIPGKLLITPKLARSRLLELGHSESLVELLDYLEILALFLHHEKSLGTESMFYLYIKTLPKDFDLPYLSDYTAFEEFLPRTLLTELEDENINAFKSFEKIRRLDPTIDIEHFKWTWSVVNTRCIYLNTVKGLKEAALAPYLDLINHSPYARTEATFDEVENCYVLKTLAPFKRNEQIFINYGDHSNRKLLVNYGFLVPSNSVFMFKVAHELLSQICDANALQNAVEVLQEATILRPMFFRPLFFEITSDGLEWKLEALIHVLGMIGSAMSSRNEIKEMLFKHDLTPTQFSRQMTHKLISKLLVEYENADLVVGPLRELMFDERNFLKQLLSKGSVY